MRLNLTHMVLNIATPESAECLQAGICDHVKATSTHELQPAKQKCTGHGQKTLHNYFKASGPRI